jgi:hypothetical protein
MITSIEEFLTRGEFVYANLGKEEDILLSNLYDLYSGHALFIADDLTDFSFCSKSFFADKNVKFTIDDIILLVSRYIFKLYQKSTKEILNNFNDIIK